MESIPLMVPVIFILTTALTLYIFYRASRGSVKVLALLLGWLLLQAIIALTGFYTVTDTMPPRFVLLTGPPLLLIISLFLIKNGRRYLDNLDLKVLTLLHIVRIPVELVLLWLSNYKAIPVLMTFEGRNFDILSGISAPIVYIIWLRWPGIKRNLLLFWNVICLGLLFNIVSIAILAAPFRFQQLAFDQPNRAVLYFPYIWLPGCIVPVVLLSHLAAIRQLILKK